MSDVHNAPAPTVATEPLGNSTEARTPEGTLKDTTQPLISEPKKEEPKTADTKPEAKKEPAAGAPEKYTPFTVPEGKELSPELTKEAEGTFKELNLSQEQGQKLVDLWNKNTSDLSSKLDQMVADQRKEWRDAIAKDKTIGNGTDNLSDASKKSIADAIAASGDAKAQSSLKSALDLTGAGDHPDIVRAFVALGKLVGEATAVRGQGPTTHSQAKPGQPRSAAQAMYPNLPSSANG